MHLDRKHHWMGSFNKHNRTIDDCLFYFCFSFSLKDTLPLSLVLLLVHFFLWENVLRFGISAYIRQEEQVDTKCTSVEEN